MLKTKHYENSWIVAGCSILLLLLFDYVVRFPQYEIQIAKLVIIAILSLFVIMKSSDYCINALAHYAKKTGISHYVIGFLIVNIGTALPDLSNTLFASLENKGSLVLGNVLGATVLACSLVLGITLIVAKKMHMKKTSINETFLVVLGVTLVTLVLGMDGVFSRMDGVILLCCFGAFVLRTLHHESKHGKLKRDVQWASIWRPMVVFIGTLIALLLAARWFVFSTITLGDQFGIPAFLMGVIFIAIGTTIPEITIGIHSALKGLHHMGLGNSIGNITLNFGLVLGIGAILRPIVFDLRPFLISIATILLCICIVRIFIHKRVLTRKHGVVLCSIYAAFILIQVLL